MQAGQAMSSAERNPYVGPRTFLKEEGHLFYGREREARDLIALVASEQLVLFYAQSGAGKSSLINTRLIPYLESKEYEVLPVSRVTGGEPTQNKIDNIYIFNLIRSLDQHDTDLHILDHRSLAEFLGNLNRDERGYFYDDSPIPELPQGETYPPPWRRALIIDQFEELFSTHPEAWQQREGFFRQLAEAMQVDPYLWVVLVMREDYIAALDPYAHLLPGALRVRYYMQRLGREAALNAVTSPVKDLRPYSEGVAEKLVDDLRSTKVQQPDGTSEMQPGQYVEPVQLQVVCYSLWENLSPEGTHITEEDLQTVGDVDQTLGRYYEERVKAVAKAKYVQERLIREWFEKKLITAGGIRNLVLREPNKKSGGLDDDVIQALQSDLVRAEKRGGATWYELTHDRLVEPIIANNNKWFNENLSPLQRQAALWKDQNQNESWLLRGKAWAEVAQWGKDHQKELTETEKDFLEASRSLVKREYRAKWLTRLIAFVGMIAIVLAIFAYQASVDAQQQTKLATARLLAAQAQSILATGNSKQMTAVLLAVQSMRMFPSIEAVQILQNNLLSRALFSVTHDNEVRCVAFSPDGKYVVSGSSDKTARVWEAGTGKEISQLTHDARVNAVAFSPDGKYVISSSSDKTARVWEAGTGREITRLLHEGNVNAVAFSPNGKYVVSGSSDKTARVWEIGTGKEVARMTHDNEVYSIAVSLDSQHVVSGSLDKTARVWEADTGTEIARRTHEGIVESVALSPDGKIVASGSEIYAHIWDAVTGEEKFLIRYGELVTSVAFSTDGNYVASGSWNHTVQVRNVTTGQSVASMIHDSNVRTVSFSPDGQYVVSGSRDNTARVWEALTGREVARMTHNGTVWAVAFSPDSKSVVSGSLDGTTRVWEATASKEIIRLPFTERMWSVTFSPDGNFLATGSGDYMVHIWEVSTGKEVARMAHDNEVFSVAFSPDGKYIVSASEDYTARIWEVASGKEIARLLHDNEVFSVAFSPDGKYIVSASEDATARIWEAATGKEIARLPHDDWVYAAAFSPDGKYVVSSSGNSLVRLWEVATGKVIASMAHDNDNDVRSVAFSPDGKYIASGSADYTVRVWETATGKEVTRMIHDSNVRTVAFSPDGKYIVSGSRDNTARVWEWQAANNKEVTRMIHIDRVNSVAFSPDGRYLVSGAEDRIVRVWLWRPEDLIDKACARVSRTLTRDEWELYIGNMEPYQTVCPNLPINPEPAQIVIP
jgi:WD40 repeat protein